LERELQNSIWNQIWAWFKFALLQLPLDKKTKIWYILLTVEFEYARKATWHFALFTAIAG
jgi:hypothetical protein